MSEEKSSEPQDEGGEIKDYIHPSLQRALEREYSSLPEVKRVALNRKFNNVADSLFIHARTRLGRDSNISGALSELAFAGEKFAYAEVRELAGATYHLFDIAARVTGGRKMNEQLKSEVERAKPGEPRYTLRRSTS